MNFTEDEKTDIINTIKGILCIERNIYKYYVKNGYDCSNIVNCDALSCKKSIENLENIISKIEG